MKMLFQAAPTQFDRTRGLTGMPHSVWKHLSQCLSRCFCALAISAALRTISTDSNLPHAAGSESQGGQPALNLSSYGFHWLSPVDLVAVKTKPASSSSMTDVRFSGDWRPLGSRSSSALLSIRKGPLALSMSGSLARRSPNIFTRLRSYQRSYARRANTIYYKRTHLPKIHGSSMGRAKSFALPS